VQLPRENTLENDSECEYFSMNGDDNPTEVDKPKEEDKAQKQL
jgi:hypothetical protein